MKARQGFIVRVVCALLSLPMGGGHHEVKIMEDKSSVRKLTPLEYWRLMGFDDSDFSKAQAVNSDTQLYKQAGNSIVVNVLEAVLKNLLGGEEMCE